MREDEFAVTLVKYVSLGAFLLFFVPIMGSLIGAFVGWCVGLFFGDTIRSVLAAFGVTGVSPWQLGMFLGFVSGFFNRGRPINDAN